MKPNGHKRFILRQLGQESEPISLSELMNKLELDYTHRTVRRWLNELVEEGLVKKSGQTKNTKYIVPKGKDHVAETTSSLFSTESLEVITQVTRPIYERQPVAYSKKWLASYSPNTSFYLPKSLREQLLLAGNRASDQDPAGTYAHQIFNRLLIDLSYNSSRLEGNTYSLLDTERLLLQGNSAEGKLDEEKVMILNHKEAIRYLVDNAPKITVNVKVIYTIHYLLAEGLVEPKYAGKPRDHGVRIGGSTYMPFEDPKVLQLQLEKIAEKAAQIEDPFEQSFFLLVHISYLQVFADVNKRTARLASNISLITKNLVPLSFNDVKVDQYMSAIIAIYELQNVQPLIDLYAYSYMRTCSAYDATVKSMGFDEVRVRYRSQRRAIIREIIISSLTGSKLDDYVQVNTQKLIPKKDRQQFARTVSEDLEYIDESRIVGMGITPEQLQNWLHRFNPPQ